MHACILLRSHRYAEARTELLACIERHGEGPGSLCNLATATNCLGLQDAAEELARRAIALAPDRPWSRLHSVQRAALSRWYHRRRTAGGAEGLLR